MKTDVLSLNMIGSLKVDVFIPQGQLLVSHTAMMPLSAKKITRHHIQRIENEMLFLQYIQDISIYIYLLLKDTHTFTYPFVAML